MICVSAVTKNPAAFILFVENVVSIIGGASHEM